MSEQWPIVGRSDLYYGGTTYDNSQGLGVQLASAAENGAGPAGLAASSGLHGSPASGLLAVPVTRLYDRGLTVLPSTTAPRSAFRSPYVAMHTLSMPPRLRIGGRETVQVITERARPHLSSLLRWMKVCLPGVVLVPRSLGIAIAARHVELKAWTAVAIGWL